MPGRASGVRALAVPALVVRALGAPALVVRALVLPASVVQASGAPALVVRALVVPASVVPVSAAQAQVVPVSVIQVSVIQVSGVPMPAGLVRRHPARDRVQSPAPRLASDPPMSSAPHSFHPAATPSPAPATAPVPANTPTGALRAGRPTPLAPRAVAAAERRRPGVVAAAADGIGKGRAKA